MGKIRIMKAMHWPLASALLLLSVFITSAQVLSPTVGLDELANQADVIFQGTTVSNTTIDDPAFQVIQGFIVQETDFHPAYAIKGKSTSDIKFRHYAPDPRPIGGLEEPQNYALEIGKSYLVFAKQPPGYAAGTCQQIWMNRTGMEDEGVLLCFRAFPLERHSMKELFWQDLTELLKSPDPMDVVYAITHLDELSGRTGHYDQISEFQHLDVLAAMHGLINNPDPIVAQAALTVLGSHNPYMTRERAQFWLATVGSADTPGLATMDTKMVNEGGPRLLARDCRGCRRQG